MEWKTDYLIAGSGIAALRAAITLAEAGDVLVLTKASSEESNTGYAQGGIAAAVGPDDSPALHARDTIAAGDGLCEDDAVRVLVDDGPLYVQELLAWGCRFERDASGALDLAHEGAHSVRRVLHAGDASGREIGRTLWRQVVHHPRVRVMEQARVIGVVVEGGRAIGLRWENESGEQGLALGRLTLLATGGAGQVFRETTNPAVATGDGIAIAYWAGARVADLEFVQFHPTVLDMPGAPRFLLSEALRGEGARLENVAGEPFMSRYEPLGDLAPRDRVARAIVRESVRTGGPVYLSLRHLSAAFVHERFPSIAATCAGLGLDLAADRLPVGPAAHYVMGGVVTDLDARTSIPGLYAAGEVAWTGVHGANRLASNSLLEGLVFGARAARAMVDDPAGVPSAPPSAVAAERPACWTEAMPSAAVRELMWTHVGLFRDRAQLEEATQRLEGAWQAFERDVLVAGASVRGGRHEAASRLTVARLMARAALRREESRGAHCRSDFPDRDDTHWKRHIVESRGEDPK